VYEAAAVNPDQGG